MRFHTAAMNDADAELRRVAHHEMGHAIAQFVLGRRIERVSIVPDEKVGSLGHTFSRLPDILGKRDELSITTLQERAQVQDWIVTAFAGAEAEARFRGVEVSEVIAEGGADYDRLLIEELGELLEPSPEPGAALLDYLRARAADLIEVHWYLIETTAPELVARRVLSGVAVRRLLREAILMQPESGEFGASGNDTPHGLRMAADWIGRSRLGWLLP